jgi:predicted DNA-binding WGR domain protein
MAKKNYLEKSDSKSPKFYELEIEGYQGDLKVTFRYI